MAVTQRLGVAAGRSIAAINGGATDGGLDWRMACEPAHASTRAKMGETYIKLGLIPVKAASYFLHAIGGFRPRDELAFTGDLIDAKVRWKSAWSTGGGADALLTEATSHCGPHRRLSRLDTRGDQRQQLRRAASGSHQRHELELLGRGPR